MPSLLSLAARSIFAFLALISSVAFAAEPDAISVRLDWSLTGYHLPFYWALSKGYYRDANLDVRIELGAGSGQTIVLVGGGHDDVGLADFSLMASFIAKGMRVEAIFGIVQSNAWAITSHRDTPILQPKDMIGRSIATIADHKPLLDLFMKINGIDPADVTVRIATAATRTSLFAAHQADGMLNLATSAPSDEVSPEEAAAKPPVAMQFGDYGVSLLGQGLIANVDFATTHADALRRFIAATRRGFLEAIDPGHVDEALKVSIDLSASSASRAEAVKRQWINTISRLNSRDQRVGCMSARDWENTLNLLVAAGRIGPADKAINYFTNAFNSCD